MSTIPASGVLMLWYHLETLLDWYWIVLFSFVCFENFRIMWPAQVYFDDDVSCISYTRYYWFLGMTYFFFWCPNLTYICGFLFGSLRPTLGIDEQTPGEIYRTLWWCQCLWSHPFRAHQALTIKLDKWASHCILFATLPWLEGTCSNELSCDIWSFPALCHCVFVFLVAGCSQLSCFKFITNQGRWIVAGQDCKPFLLVLQAKRQEVVKKEKPKMGLWKRIRTFMMCTPLRFAKAFGHWWGHQPSQGEVGGWHICSCERVYFLHRTSATPFARPHCGAHSHIFPHHKQKPGFAFCQVSVHKYRLPMIIFCLKFIYVFATKYNKSHWPPTIGRRDFETGIEIRCDTWVVEVGRHIWTVARR